MKSIDNLIDIDQLAQVLIGSKHSELSKSDLARGLVINLFATFFIPLCVIASFVLYTDGKTTIASSLVALAILCTIPLVLNRIGRHEVSFVIYTFQSSVLVAFYSLHLGKDFNIQNFFIPLFAFPFIFLRSSNTLGILFFIVFNELCLLYVQFGNPAWIDPIVWTEDEVLLINIVVQAVLAVFCGVLMFALYQTQIKTELRLITHNKKLQKAYNAKQEFLSTMSHEIRTPLNAVISIASLLDAEDKEAEERNLIETLRYSSNNLLNIINDILDFSKLEAEKIELDYRNYDLNQLLQNTASTYRTLADEKGLDFHVDIDASLSATYFFDDVKLGQILANLITNAIKFTEVGSVKLSVKTKSTESDYETLSFSIEDTGIGISKDEIPLLYNSFSQIKKDITRTQEGTGLGLAISKGLLKLYNSDIQVESTVGAGSTFSFELTLKRGTDKIQRSTNPSNTFKDKKILLVEDNPINGMVAGKILERWGVDFDLVENGQLAFNACEKIRYDLILMDLHMPVMDGFTSTQLIKTNSTYNQDTPVFALTADVLGEQVGDRYGFFDKFLTKPIEQKKMHGLLTEYWEAK